VTRLGRFQGCLASTDRTGQYVKKQWDPRTRWETAWHFHDSSLKSDLMTFIETVSDFVVEYAKRNLLTWPLILSKQYFGHITIVTVGTIFGRLPSCAHINLNQGLSTLRFQQTNNLYNLYQISGRSPVNVYFSCCDVLSGKLSLSLWFRECSASVARSEFFLSLFNSAIFFVPNFFPFPHFWGVLPRLSLFSKFLDNHL